MNLSDWEKIDTERFKRMYLNPPRVANEMLTPYKRYFAKRLKKLFTSLFPIA